MFNKKSNGWFDFQLELCFESIIHTLFLLKSESIRLIGSVYLLKLLFKAAIQRKFLAKSANLNNESIVYADNKIMFLYAYKSKTLNAFKFINNAEQGEFRKLRLYLKIILICMCTCMESLICANH